MNQTILSLSRASRALSIGALLALGICGCTNDDLVDQTSPTTGSEANVTLTARIESGAGTRTGHEEESATDPSKKGVKVTWAVGDKISVETSPSLPPNSPPVIFTLNGINTDGSGTFSGPAEPAPKGEGSAFYIVTYPPLKDYMNPSFPMTGQVQSGNGNMDHLGAYDLMAALADNWKKFSFKADDHYNALMTFDLDGIPADLGIPKCIILGCTDTESHFYSNCLGLPDPDLPTLTLGLTGFPAVTAGKQQIKAYMMLAPAEIPTGASLTITVVGDRNSCTYTSPAMGADGMPYEAGKRYTAKVTAQDTWVKDASTTTTATYTGAEAAVAFANGDGTQAKPFLIENAGHLRTLIDGLLSNSGYTGKYFKLTTNIDIQMAGDGKWIPIGSSSNPFKGNFDGDGYTISGTLTRTGYDFGFFGYIEGATITNLTMNATVSGGGSVGGIVGNVKGAPSRISYCTNRGNVTGTNTYVGGIVGNVESESFITHCTNTGVITSKQSGVGGIAGSVDGDATGGGKNAFIIECTNRGAIMTTSFGSNNGGIVGSLYNATLIACVNQGEVSSVSSSCGGIAAVVNSSSAMVACYNTANVSTVANKFNVGGITGGLKGSTTLTASYNTGKVTGGSSDLSGAIAGGATSLPSNITTTISYCQYVLASDNSGLLIYPATGTPTTATENTKHATFSELNAAGVAALNIGITEWNNANAAGTAKHCPYHFVAGTAGGTPMLAAGAPVID